MFGKEITFANTFETCEIKVSRKCLGEFGPTAPVVTPLPVPGAFVAPDIAGAGPAYVAGGANPGGGGKCAMAGMRMPVGFVVGVGVNACGGGSLCFVFAST